MRAELKGLPVELAEKVGLRLLAAGLLVDEDPAEALAQARVAHRLAARLPVVRAAMAETAYAAGEFATALNEYRALRRMSGGDEYLPIIADCERAVGRPAEALQIARSAAELSLPAAVRIEMTIVEAGARSDQGQQAEALRVLQREIERTRGERGVSAEAAARLRFAYADQLLAKGDEQGAKTWFAAAAALDTEQVTEAAERVAELEGMRLDVDDLLLEEMLDPNAFVDPDEEPSAEDEGSSAEDTDGEESAATDPEDQVSEDAEVSDASGEETKEA